MKLGKTYFSGSLTFDEGTNTLGPNSSNITGSFSGSLKGTITATGDIIPAVSGAYDLGSTAFPFKDLYITQNSLKFIDDTTGSEIGRISVNSNTGDIKLLNTKNLSDEQKASLTAENVGAEALSPVSASSLWVSQSINPGHERTTLGHTNQKFHTLHTQFVSASSAHLDGDLKVGGKVTAQEFHTEFVSASIVYQSGSTKFGDTADDTHEFTGSVDVSGSLYIKGGEQPGLITNVTSYFSLVSTGDTSNTTGARIWLGNGQNDAGYYQNANGHYFRDLSSNLQMYINGTGNVGIGTNNPTTALHVQGEISIGGGESTDDARMYFKASDNSNRFTIETDLEGVTDNDILGFRSSATDNVIVLKGDGNVGIGTNNPLTKLHIDGTASPTIRLESTSGPYSLISSNTVGSVEIAADAGNGGVGTNINFKVDDYNVMRIASSGDQGKVGIGTTSPESNSKLDVRGNLLVGGGSTYAGTGVTSVTINNDLYPLLSLGSTSSNRMELIAYSSYNLFSSSNNFVFDTGNVGIGAQPSAKLDVVSTSAKIAEFERQGSANYDLTISDIGAGAAQLFFNANTNDTGFVFRPKTSGGSILNALLIDSNGNVGIGTVNPYNKLHVHVGAGTPGFSKGIRIHTRNETYTTGHGGMLEFQNEDVLTAGIRGVRESGWASGLAFYTHTATSGNTFDSTFVEQMRIDYLGRVGIGITSPARKFHVKAPDNDIAVFESDSHGIVFQDDGTRFEIVGYKQSGPGYNDIHLRADVDNTLVLKASTGNVGIGTAGPTAKLQVYGDMTVGATSPETKVTVDGGVKADAFWIHDRVGWIATISPEGWDTVVSTGTISSSGGSTSLDILSVYTDGHWGGSAFGEIWTYTSYYGAGIRKYKFYASRAGYVSVVEIDSSGTEAPMTIDVHSTSIIGSGTHNGQSVAKSVIRLNTGSSYVQARALIKLGHSDNSRKIFDNRSTDANVQADRVTNGGAYHFRSVDLSDLPYISTV